MKKFVLALAGLAVVFLAGYVPPHFEAKRLTEELQESSSRYENRLLESGQSNSILRLQRDLGLLLIEMEDQNYGRAREFSTVWFDHLSEAIASARDDSTRQTLTALYGRRDMVTGMLVGGDAEAATAVREMYRALARASDSE